MPFEPRAAGPGADDFSVGRGGVRRGRGPEPATAQQTRSGQPVARMRPAEAPTRPRRGRGPFNAVLTVAAGAAVIVASLLYRPASEPGGAHVAEVVIGAVLVLLGLVGLFQRGKRTSGF